MLGLKPTLVSTILLPSCREQQHCRPIRRCHLRQPVEHSKSIWLRSGSSPWSKRPPCKSADQNSTKQTRLTCPTFSGSWLTSSEGRVMPSNDRQSSLVHRHLGLNPIVAGDAGFWRWLTFSGEGELADLVDWRYPGQDSGHAREQYFGLGQMKEGMYAYLWLCAQSVWDPTLEDPYELSRRGDVDVWQSHVVRIDFGSVPQLARAFIRFVFPDEETAVSAPRTIPAIGQRSDSAQCVDGFRVARRLGEPGTHS